MRLHRTDASGITGEQVAATSTDADGRFRFAGIQGIEGGADLLVVVDLGGDGSPGGSGDISHHGIVASSWRAAATRHQQLRWRRRLWWV